MIRLTLAHPQEREYHVYLNVDHIVAVRPYDDGSVVMMAGRLKNPDGSEIPLRYEVREDAATIAGMCEQAWTGRA